MGYFDTLRGSIANMYKLRDMDQGEFEKWAKINKNKIIGETGFFGKDDLRRIKKEMKKAFAKEFTGKYNSPDIDGYVDNWYNNRKKVKEENKNYKPVVGNTKNNRTKKTPVKSKRPSNRKEQELPTINLPEFTVTAPRRFKPLPLNLSPNVPSMNSVMQDMMDRSGTFLPYQQQEIPMQDPMGSDIDIQQLIDLYQQTKGFGYNQEADVSNPGFNPYDTIVNMRGGAMHQLMNSPFVNPYFQE